MADEQYRRTVEQMIQQTNQDLAHVRAETSRHNELITSILTEQREQRGIVAEIRAESLKATHRSDDLLKDVRNLRGDIKELIDRIHATDIDARERVAEHERAMREVRDARQINDGDIRVKWWIAGVTLVITVVLFMASLAAEFIMRML